MEAKYKFYIVIDGVKHAILMTESHAGEEAATEFIRSMSNMTSIWIGLEDGNMVSVNNLTGSVYCIAERV